LSSYGKEIAQRQEVQEATVQEVAEEINALGAQAKREDFLNLAIRYADDDERLQALVGLVRPAFDYQFFTEMTARIGQAPADERERLEALRDLLTELTTAVDRQQQAVVAQAVSLLQAIVNAENPDELIRANLPLIDDTFLAVLSANIEESERRRDVASSGRLKAVYNKVVTILQENMQPELRFVNQLLSTQTDEEAQQMIAEHVNDYGEALLDVMDAVGQVLAQRGDKETVEKLVFLRTAAEKALG
jgi:hypothetical protein